MKEPRLYYLLLFALVLFSCKKDVSVPAVPTPTLPSPTERGANMVAWYADAAPYIADSSKTSCTVQIDTNSHYSIFNTGSFRIQTSYIDSGGYKRALLLTSPANTNVSFPISSGTAFGIAAYSDNTLFEQAMSGDNDLALPITGGQIVVTHCDFSKKILSGTFEFVTMPSGSTTARKVSGWFDMTFSLQERNLSKN